MTPNAQPTRVESFDRSALAQLLEPPYTDPYVRWCGRGGAARLPPIPIDGPISDIASGDPYYSITLSPRRRYDSGMVTPTMLAALRLMNSSNLVGCSIGKSPGFVPFNILST